MRVLWKRKETVRMCSLEEGGKVEKGIDGSRGGKSEGEY